jgi:hypothetical protein
MDRRQIIELHQRGHIIGSHSCSHPLRMANCSWQQMLREWKVSTAILSELLGRQIETASIPGGHYSLQVAESASEAGVKILFTSEPKDSCEIVGGCLTLGRYSIQRWTTPDTVAAIASGKLAPRAWQTFLWESKKLIKNVGGQYYLKLRTSLSGKS